MLSDKLQEALCEHMTSEFFAAYSYLAMAAWYEAEDLPGFANFFRIQYQEEMIHGMKFFDFLCEAGARPDLGSIAEPRKNYSSPMDPFMAGMEQEQAVTKRINGLMDLASEEKAHAAKVFLQWFVTEQLEEESLFGVYVKKLKLIGDDGRGIVALDRELGSRSLEAGGE
jgi:ferritin